MVRAGRRCGELLKETEKNKGNLKQGVKLPQSNASTTVTLSAMGLTKNQFNKLQQLANVPADEFERGIKIPDTSPSTAGLPN